MRVANRLKEMGWYPSLVVSREFKDLHAIDPKIELVDMGIQKYLNACARGFSDGVNGLAADDDDRERCNRVREARRIWLQNSNPGVRGVILNKYDWRGVY